MRHRSALLVVDDEVEFETPAQPPSHRLAPALRCQFAVVFLVGAGYALGIGDAVTGAAALVVGVLLLGSGRVAAAGVTGALLGCLALLARPGAAWAAVPALLLLLWIAPATYGSARRGGRS